jgi:hypothetical protein
MKKFFIGASIVAVALSIVPANAASTLAVANGNSIGFVNTAAGALAVGNAAATSQQAGVSTSVGTGIAVATPLGGFSAGVGSSLGQTQGVSAAAAAGPLGIAATTGHVLNIGNGNGAAFTNVLP